MSLNNEIFLAGCKINLISLYDLTSLITQKLNRRAKPLLISSANLQHLRLYGLDGSHSSLFDELAYEGKLESLTLLDGAPLVKQAAKITGVVHDKLSGSDILDSLIQLCISNNKSFGILGGPQSLGDDFASYAKINYPDLKFDSWHPARDILDSKSGSANLANEIKKAKIDFLCVALPKPISELWIKEYGIATKAKVLAAFGASVNFLIGTQKRAPKLFQNLGIEWAWRLISEPKRLFRRYILEGFGEYYRLKRYSGTKRTVATPKLWRSRLTSLLIAVDIISLSLASMLAALVRVSFGKSFTGYAPSWITVFSAIPLVLIVSGFFKARSITSSKIDTDNYLNFCYGILAGISVMGLISYTFRLETSRGYLLLLTFMGISFGLLGRTIISILLINSRKKGFNLINLAHIGSSILGNEIIAKFKSSSSFGYRVIGREFSVIEAYNFGIGVIAADGFTPQQLSSADSQVSEHCEIIILPQISQVASNRLVPETIGTLSLIHLLPVELGGYRAIVKRTLDITITLLSFILVIPIGLVVSLLIFLEDKGPVFFVQQRVGRDGKLFTLYKFRSMHTNAESLLESLRESNQAGDILFKMQDDPRITKIGKFIRKWSLDELPQLINVLLGEMSLVGPRPALGHEVEKYPTQGHNRHRVRPGITGLWQVSGRSNLDSQEALALDLYYVANWSVNQDLLILTRTLKAVLSKDGAY